MNDNKVIIFHHNDMDGKVSAALIYAYEYYYKMTKSINITCKEIDYTVLLNDDIKEGMLIKVEEENNTNFTKNDIKNIIINYLNGSDDEALDLLLQDNEVDTSRCNVSEFFKVMDCIRELYNKCE